ncbi:MAG: hypothetical protein ACFFFB_05320 [Candidatus Heimdallarchaeota archaeon]
MVKNKIQEHEENIAKILDRVISFCKQSGFIDLAQKGEYTLRKYSNSKKQ